MGGKGLRRCRLSSTETLDTSNMWSIRMIIRILYMDHVSNMAIRWRIATVSVYAIVRKRRLSFYRHASQALEHTDHKRTLWTAMKNTPKDWRRTRCYALEHNELEWWGKMRKSQI